MIQRFLSLTLAGAVLASVAAVAPTTRVEAATYFSDASGHWAESPIRKMSLKGVLQGTAAGKFEPNRAVSRLELAVMLVRAEGLDQEARSSTTAPVQMVGYQSLPSWSRGYMSYAIALGLLDDEDLANFRPNDDALRYQVAVMMVRALGQEAEAKRITTLPNYTDAYSIPLWARGYVSLATTKGLFKGDAAGKFRPLDTVTRGEMAALLDRLDKLQDNNLDTTDMEGTVTDVILGTAPHLELTLANGTSTTLYLNQGAWVARGGSPTTFSSIRVGDRVTAVRDPLGGYGYLEAEGTSNRTVTGILADDFNAATKRIVVTVSGSTTSYAVATTSPVIHRDDVAANDDDLMVGDRLTLTLVDDKVTEIDATTDTTSVTGTLADAFPVGARTITLTVSGTDRSYTLSSTSISIKKDGRSASADDIWVGDRVTLTLANDRVTAISASSVSRTVRGFVTSVVVSTTAPAIGVTVGTNPEQVYQIPSNVSIYENSRAITISDVRLGAYVEITASGSSATRVTIANKEYLQELAGVITAVNASRREITIAITDEPIAPSGATRKVIKVPTGAIVIKHGGEVSFSSLEVGDRVMAAGSISSGTYTAQTIVVTFTDAP
ncbi:MAG: S-layer homology domain-containing protein [Bacillota bacterium]